MLSAQQSPSTSQAFQNNQDLLSQLLFRVKAWFRRMKHSYNNALEVMMPNTSRGDSDEEEEHDRLLFGGLERAERGRHIRESRAKKRKAWIAIGSVAGALGLLGLILGLVYGLRHRRPTFKFTGCPSDSMQNFDLVWFVVGDWGARYEQPQAVVAQMMGELGTCYHPSFVISTGDNFYSSGLKGPNDPEFKRIFSDVYTHPSLQVPWYAVLGNHDYGDRLKSHNLWGCSAPTLSACPAGCCYSPVWQTNMTHMDWRWHAQQGVWKQTFMNGTLDFIFIDTNPLIEKYREEVWAANAGGLSSRPPGDERAAILKAIQTSTARWKVVVGHHPVRSFGEHCTDEPDCLDMQFLKPWLNDYKVPVYLSGHEHDLQLIKAATDPVYYVVSGAGSDMRTGEFDKIPAAERRDAKYLADHYGFVVAGIKDGSITLHYWINTQSTPAYTVTFPLSI